MVESTALARKRNTPVTSWIDFFIDLLSGTELSGAVTCCTFAPYYAQGSAVGFVVQLGGVLEALESIFDVCWH